MKVKYSSLLNLWFFSLIMNSIFIKTPYMGMHTITIMGIPMGYIPFIISLSIIILFSKFKFPKLDSIMMLSIGGIIFYCIFSILYVIDYKSWFTYFFMWFFYIISFLLLIEFYYLYITLEDFVIYLNRMLIIFSAVSLVGLCRFLLFGFGDANPWPFINRNGVIFSFVPFIPLILALKDYHVYNNFKFLVMLSLILLNMILIFSRTGYIGVFVSIFGYYIFNFSISKLSTFFKMLLRSFITIIVLYMLVINIPYFKGKLTIGFNTISKLIEFNEIKAGEPDYRRFLLMKEAIRIFKEHWILGTGLGLDNYLHYFNENTIPAKPHSFYISYLAEFGLLGFSFLILFLISLTLYLYKAVRLTSEAKEKFLALGFLVGHLSILIMFFFNEYITAPYTWFFWATAVSFSLIVKKQRVKSCIRKNL